MLSHRFFRCAALLALFCAPLVQAAKPVPSPPELSARSFFLVDAASGTILAEKNARDPVEPASITKVLTGYVAFHELVADAMQLSDKVRVSQKAWKTEGSRMFIKSGDIVDVEQLLKGMIIQSGNDASVALAEHIAGTENTFAQLMNQHAQKLGMVGSHFSNSTGLPHPDHYTTARDLALLAEALIKEFPQYYEWYSIKEMTYNKIRQFNRNKLLWRDNRVDGLKTGHTSSAGYCLLSSGKKDEMRLIAVVLGTESDKQRLGESQALLNYGFRFFETHKIYDTVNPIQNEKVWKGEIDQLPIGVENEMFVTVPRGRYADIVTDVIMKEKLTAPISVGQEVGTAVLSLDGKELGSQPVVAMADIGLGGFFSRLIDDARLFFQ